MWGMPYFHPQDWLIIFQSLIQWAGNPEYNDAPREVRAWELAELIARENGLAPSECHFQIDDSWSGSNRDDVITDSTR